MRGWAVAACGHVLGGMLYSLVMVSADWAMRTYPVQFSGAALLLVLTWFVVGLVKENKAHREMARQVTDAGWVPVEAGSRDWPWTGEVKVHRAWSFSAQGLPVVAGEIRWRGDALAGMVSTGTRGLFVVVELPSPAPLMKYHLEYELVGAVPPDSESPLRANFLLGRIPAWTVCERELFTVHKCRVIRPALVADAVQRTFRVADLLHLTSPGDDHDER
nr:hypothetical protein Ade03nite_93670 [Actinoplanes derwentensis]